MKTYALRISIIMLPLGQKCILKKGQYIPHCGRANSTVDHLATKCDRMLGYDYVRRHNEVVRCIHLGLCNKYGFTTERN